MQGDSCHHRPRRASIGWLRAAPWLEGCLCERLAPCRPFRAYDTPLSLFGAIWRIAASNRVVAPGSRKCPQIFWRCVSGWQNHPSELDLQGKLPPPSLEACTKRRKAIVILFDQYCFCGGCTGILICTRNSFRKLRHHHERISDHLVQALTRVGLRAGLWHVSRPRSTYFSVRSA
jgi:hypothetical protein